MQLPLHVLLRPSLSSSSPLSVQDFHARAAPAEDVQRLLRDVVGAVVLLRAEQEPGGHAERQHDAAAHQQRQLQRRALFVLRAQGQGCPLTPTPWRQGNQPLERDARQRGAAAKRAAPAPATRAFHVLWPWPEYALERLEAAHDRRLAWAGRCSYSPSRLQARPCSLHGNVLFTHSTQGEQRACEKTQSGSAMSSLTDCGPSGWPYFS